MVLPFMVGLTACHDEHAEYEPATGGNYDIAHLIYFSPVTTAATEVELSEEENSFDLYLVRDSTQGEVTVKLESSQKAGNAPSLLNIPESATFADGVDMVAVTVTYDPEAILAAGGMIDTVSVVIPDGEVYQSGYQGGKYNFVASLLPFTPWCTSAEEFAAAGGQGEWPFRDFATGTYTFTQYATGDQEGVAVAFRQNTGNPNQVQFLLENWGEMVFTAAGSSVRLSGTWDEDLGVYVLSWPETFTGYTHSTYGPVNVSDFVEYRGGAVSWDEYPTKYNPETGLFTFNLIYYVSAGYFGYGEEYLQMDGFKAYEANIDEDFEWTEQFVGVFNSGKLGTKGSAALMKGTCVNTTDGCDTVFAAKYGTAYKIVAPYAEGKDLIFCVDNEGKIVLAPGYTDPQATGINAVGEEAFAQINPKKGSFSETEIVLNITFVNESGSIEYGTANEVLQNITWTAQGLGTFNYTFWWEGSDEGYVFYQRDDQKDTYKIEDWGGGIDFMFTWDQATNQCEVLEQYIGDDHATYGPVYIIEGAQYSERFAEKTSYYDPESKTFYFYPVYFVEAGYFGQGEETFEVTESAAVKTHSAKKVQMKNVTKVRRSSSRWMGRPYNKFSRLANVPLEVKF